MVKKDTVQLRMSFQSLMVATRSRAQSVIGESPSSSNILPISLFPAVTGCLGWTVYPLPDYRGRGLCLLPSDEVRCNPGFYVSALRRGEIKTLHDLNMNIAHGMLFRHHR